MGRGGTTTRRQVKQTLGQYTRALNTPATNRDKGEQDGEAQTAQAVLNAFQRMVKNARACEIPALAVLHLPVPPGRISVVFDKYEACNDHYNDSNIVILVTKTGAEIYWYHASVTTHRGY